MPLQVRMQSWMASLSVATTQGMHALLRTVEVRQLGYMASMSITSKILEVMALARPTPSALPWLISERFRNAVRWTWMPPCAKSVENVPVMLGSTPVPE